MPEMSVNALKGNLSNPQRVYLWEILVPAPVGGGEVEVFTLRAQSAQIPTREQGQIKIPYKQTPGYVVPGKLRFDQTWECTFIEGEDHKVWNAINGWLQQIVDVRTGTGLGDAAIKTDILLNLVSVANANTLRIKLKGCYVMRLGAVDLNYTTEGMVVYSVTFSFDSVETVEE